MWARTSGIWDIVARRAGARRVGSAVGPLYPHPMTYLLAAMPAKTGPSLIGPQGDIYYAVFVGVVVVAMFITFTIMVLRGSREK